jgi:hypothetical protein
MSDPQAQARAFPPEVEQKLRAIYEEMTWLGQRDGYGVSAAMARGWAVTKCDKIRSELRLFTGYVSKQSLLPGQDLVHEHHRRIHKSITALVEGHLRDNLNHPGQFIAKIADLESVNITTRAENERIRHAGGDYPTAGVTLMDWNVIDDAARQMEIWTKKIKRKVSNWQFFEPGPARWPPSA